MYNLYYNFYIILYYYWEIQEFKIDPEEFGINYTEVWEKITLEEMQEVMASPSDELKKLVRLNAALVLVAANRVSDLKEGYDLLSK